MNRRIKAVGVGLFMAIGWTTFLFFLAGTQLLAPTHYHYADVQRSADTFRIGYLAFMGFLYIAALAHSLWTAIKVWKGEL